MRSTSEEINKELSDQIKTLLEFDRSNEKQWFECTYCHQSVYEGYRYRCLECASDYDLCSECFENKRKDPNHPGGHAMVRLSENNELHERTLDSIYTLNLSTMIEMFQHEIHEDYCCNRCKVVNITGVRFHCESCRDYDLCVKCFLEETRLTASTTTSDEKQHTPEHFMIAIGQTNSKKIDISNIKLLELIGDGAFAKVWKARLIDTDQIVACKIINIDPNSSNKPDKPGKLTANMLAQSFVNELNAYNEIKGKNILRQIGHSRKDNQNGTFDLYLLTELMKNASLAHLLLDKTKMAQLSFRRRLDIAVGIASGMSRIHDIGFFHRDIRPANIFLSADLMPKIGDMGLAKIFDEKKLLHTAIGPLNYMPPEFYTRNYTKKLDVYTFGLTMVELFDGEHELWNREVIVRKPPAVFGELLEHCLQSDPKQRLTSRQIENHLSYLKKVFENIVLKNPAYICLPVSERNIFFMKISKEFWNYSKNYKPSVMINNEDDRRDQRIVDFPPRTELDNNKKISIMSQDNESVEKEQPLNEKNEKNVVAKNIKNGPKLKRRNKSFDKKESTTGCKCRIM